MLIIMSKEERSKLGEICIANIKGSATFKQAYIKEGKNLSIPFNEALCDFLKASCEFAEFIGTANFLTKED